jgi:hypothetical protein
MNLLILVGVELVIRICGELKEALGLSFSIKELMISSM